MFEISCYWEYVEQKPSAYFISIFIVLILAGFFQMAVAFWHEFASWPLKTRLFFIRTSYRFSPLVKFRTMACVGLMWRVLQKSINRVVALLNYVLTVTISNKLLLSSKSFSALQSMSTFTTHEEINNTCTLSWEKENALKVAFLFIGGVQSCGPDFRSQLLKSVQIPS